MENNKPRTIDDFFIERFLKLEEENRQLQLKLEEKQRTIDEYQQEYEETYNLIEKIKEDFEFELCFSKTIPSEVVIYSANMVFESIDKEKFEYYKQVFNLKEKGE